MPSFTTLKRLVLFHLSGALNTYNRKVYSTARRQQFRKIAIAKAKVRNSRNITQIKKALLGLPKVAPKTAAYREIWGAVNLTVNWTKISKHWR